MSIASRTVAHSNDSITAIQSFHTADSAIVTSISQNGDAAVSLVNGNSANQQQQQQDEVNTTDRYAVFSREKLIHLLSETNDDLQDYKTRYECACSERQVAMKREMKALNFNEQYQRVNLELHQQILQLQQTMSKSSTDSRKHIAMLQGQLCEKERLISKLKTDSTSFSTRLSAAISALRDKLPYGVLNNEIVNYIRTVVQVHFPDLTAPTASATDANANAADANRYGNLDVEDNVNTSAPPSSSASSCSLPLLMPLHEYEVAPSPQASQHDALISMDRNMRTGTCMDMILNGEGIRSKQQWRSSSVNASSPMQQPTSSSSSSSIAALMPMPTVTCSGAIDWKQCRRCGQVKSLQHAFYRRSSSKDGKQPMCMACFEVYRSSKRARECDYPKSATRSRKRKPQSVQHQPQQHDQPEFQYECLPAITTSSTSNSNSGSKQTH